MLLLLHYYCINSTVTYLIIETLVITHQMTEVAHGLLMGATSKATWKSHLLRARNHAGDQIHFPFFLRIEFQDGSRKEPTQDYHGSGRPHLHMLIFGDFDDLSQKILMDINS